MSERQQHDVIVVGAGSSGCALAARLSEDRTLRVLLLEAGGAGAYDPRIHLPPLFVALHGSGRDWNYRTEPQAALDGRRLRWPRGRVLGGSSATNYLVYLRGHPAVYDSWGVPGWRYDDLLPAFKRLEDHPLGPSRWHGRGGPVGVAHSGWENDLVDAFVEAAHAIGIERCDDLEGAAGEGVGRYRLTLRNGRRESGATAYLAAAARRPNLAVRTDATVARVLVQNDRARGVEVRSGDGSEEIRAGAIVLCSGAIGSPVLLLRSGIGPAAELREIDLPVVAESPQVGHNLVDHLLVPVVFGAPATATMPVAGLLPWNLLDYAVRRRGPWSSNVAEAGALIRTSVESPVPDLQLTFVLGPTVNHGRALPLPAVSLSVVGLQPKSRGRIWLSGSDPAAPPRIDPSYCSEADDMRVIREGVGLSRRIAAQAPLAARLGDEREPGSAVTEEDALEAWIRRRAQTSYHPVGTCRMGVDQSSVVDPHLRVRGIDRLWVADASIMPQIPSANTNAACLMIGERAAELIPERL